MKPRSTRLFVIGIVVLAVVVGFAATWAASSPAACTSCHRSYRDAQRGTAHADTACLACHGPGFAGRAIVGSIVLGQMLPARLLGRSPAGPVSELPKAPCLECHASIEETVSAGASGVRIKHRSCAAGASCDSCHSTTAHGEVTRWPRESVMQVCTACHAARKVSVACETCHVGNTSIAERLSTGPWQVTHGANWRQTHGMGDLDSCITCHAADYCARCHNVPIPHPATFGSEHGQLALKDQSSCLQCHKTETFCSSCHGYPMPHPDGFLETHSTAAKTYDNPTCLRCHPQSACDGCHIAHVHPGFGAVHKPSSSGGSR